MRIETNGCGSNRSLGLTWRSIRSATTVDCLQSKVNKSYSHYPLFYCGTNLKAFNGKEKDDETYGGGNAYDYGFRIYDSRLGRFLSIDPLSGDFPWWTPYQYAGNSPIRFIDLDGLETANPPIFRSVNFPDGSYQGLYFSFNKAEVKDKAPSESQVINSALNISVLRKTEVMILIVKNKNGAMGMLIQAKGPDDQDGQVRLDKTVKHDAKTGKTSAVIGGEVMEMVAVIHNHPSDDKSGPKENSDNGPSSSDVGLANSFKVPNYIIGPDVVSRVDGNEGSPESQTAVFGAEGGTIFQNDYYQIGLTNDLKSGNFSIIDDVSKRNPIKGGVSQKAEYAKRDSIKSIKNKGK